MKRLLLTLAIAAGLLAACGPAATPTIPLVTPQPSLPTLAPSSPGASPSAAASMSPLSTP